MRDIQRENILKRLIVDCYVYSDISSRLEQNQDFKNAQDFFWNCISLYQSVLQ